ncbi:hypothetical protein, partial [Oceanimonas smirnovii]|uniref:hypothetical protein n=1 Tax=Oceanimonas smirnovii TaxID=264574 RepID=UPI003FD49A8F
GNTKINEMVNELLPFFMLNYSQRLIRNLAFDLVRWNRLKTGKLLNKLPNKEEVKLTHKILELVSLETSKEVLDEFYLELEQFPLLQFRLFKIADSYKNPKSLRKVLALHEKKVSWQIRRIYRTRNIIVHSGRPPEFIHTLIENAHDYLDQILYLFISLTCEDYRVKSIEQSFELMGIKWKTYQKKLENLEKFENNNCRFIVDESVA